MNATYIHASFSKHKQCDENHGASCEQLGDNQVARENEPRAAREQRDSGSMNCDLLRWAAEQDDLQPHLQGILIRLTKLMDHTGAIALPQAQIAPHIRLGVTQTRAAIKALVAEGVIIRKRRGSIGGGRASDILTANFARQHDNADASLLSGDNTEGPSPSSLSEKSQNADTIDPSVLSRRRSAALSALSSVDNSQAPCIGTGARAETLTFISTSSTDNSERKGVGALEPDKSKTTKRGSRLPSDWRPSDEDTKYAFVNGIRGEWLENTVANFVGYWSNLPGQKGLKLNWSQAWEGEVRKEMLAQRHKPSNVAKFSAQQPRRRANGITPLAYTG